ncbi:CgeB family protein [Beggiatoa leptomitoformis]|uniref:Glycosyltransferase n=1 Tax=Beggiatoa leptomitoformis TaxID=288004 RepID=A0A2N9YEK4_9GAMM|nr:glycosyltransferase [Beggiatoa leptomitoformis]ALG68714.1 glycosyltransferase [Beggiatoa leptomitoformis]AUI68931.1 glycosyltransferase [Beggiatoa leptomitoformis]
MKILFISDRLNTDGRSYQRKCTFEELGYTVITYPAVPVEDVRKKPLFIDRVLWKLGFQRDLTHLNQQLPILAQQHQPDIIWIEKGNTVAPATLRRLKQRLPHSKLVSFSEDDMFARHNRCWFYTWGLKEYNIVFTTKSYNCQPNELPSLGAKKVVFIDKSYDAQTHYPRILSTKEQQDLGGDVGFIGSYEKERAESLLFLAKNGIKVRIWGTGHWQTLQGQSESLLIENKPLYGENYLKGLAAFKINLCFLRKANRDLQTDRTMEIPACGGFMLAERTEEHLRLFEEDKEAVYFSSESELLEKVRYYLSHETERQAIASAARVRCINSGYSHHERLKQMLAYL